MMKRSKPSRPHLFRLFARDRDGGTAVEFAVGVSVLILFMVGVMEFGRMIWISNSLQYVAEMTVRHAIVNEEASETELQEFARSNMPAMQPGDVTVQMTRTSSSGVDFVEIVVSHNFAPMFGLIPIGSPTLRGRAETATY